MGTILVVDDAGIMREALKNIIKLTGHEVAGEAINGKDALEKYKKYKPDLVTMDITMESSDGIEGLRLIMEHNPNANVIMCSAMGQKEFVLNAFSLGAVNFIVKPFETDNVIKCINEFFADYKKT